MAFEEIHAQYGDQISFFGTIGTQTTMPFGTPEEVKAEVTKKTCPSLVKKRRPHMCSNSFVRT